MKDHVHKMRHPTVPPGSPITGHFAFPTFDSYPDIEGVHDIFEVPTLVQMNMEKGAVSAKKVNKWIEKMHNHAEQKLMLAAGSYFTVLYTTATLPVGLLPLREGSVLVGNASLQQLLTPFGNSSVLQKKSSSLHTQKKNNHILTL